MTGSSADSCLKLLELCGFDVYRLRTSCWYPWIKQGEERTKFQAEISEEGEISSLEIEIPIMKHSSLQNEETDDHFVDLNTLNFRGIRLEKTEVSKMFTKNEMNTSSNCKAIT